MIIVNLTRYLEYGDVARLEIQIPYAPFVGLVIDTHVSMRDGIFTVGSVRYNGLTGATWVSEEGDDWYLGPQFSERPSSEWLEQQVSENEKARVERIKEYEAAGWTVKRSGKQASYRA
jgi:hypothetical protein